MGPELQTCAPDPLSALGAANLLGLSDVLGYCGGLLTLQLKPVMLGRFPACSGCWIVYENIASRALGECQFNLKARCHPVQQLQRGVCAVLMPLLLPKGCPKLGSASCSVLWQVGSEAQTHCWQHKGWSRPKEGLGIWGGSFIPACTCLFGPKAIVQPNG